VEPPGVNAQGHHLEERLNGWGQGPEPVGQLRTELIDLGLRVELGQPLVQREALVDLGHVALRQQGLHVHRDDRLQRLRRGGTLQFCHGLRQQLGI
jgi:hypothetical protein